MFDNATNRYVMDPISDMRSRGYEPTCATCQRYYAEHMKKGSAPFAPHHRASAGCESGKQPHCTCDRCW